MKNTKDFNIPLDEKINLDLNFEQVNLIYKALVTASETFKTGAHFMLGKDKEKVNKAIQDFTALQAYIETVLINVELDLGGNNE